LRWEISILSNFDRRNNWHTLFRSVFHADSKYVIRIVLTSRTTIKIQVFQKSLWFLRENLKKRSIKNSSFARNQNHYSIQLDIFHWCSMFDVRLKCSMIKKKHFVHRIDYVVRNRFLLIFCAYFISRLDLDFLILSIEKEDDLLILDRSLEIIPL
jgi:hypothetical protein